MFDILIYQIDALDLKNDMYMGESDEKKYFAFKYEFSLNPSCFTRLINRLARCKWKAVRVTYFAVLYGVSTQLG